MIDERLEYLSDQVRKGIPVSFDEAIEVINYQESKNRKQPKKKDYTKLNKVLFIILFFIGMWGTYTIRNEVHFFWIAVDIVSWTIVCSAPWLLPLVRRGHEKSS